MRDLKLDGAALPVDDCHRVRLEISLWRFEPHTIQCDLAAAIDDLLDPSLPQRERWKRYAPSGGKQQLCILMQRGFARTAAIGLVSEVLPLLHGALEGQPFLAPYAGEGALPAGGNLLDMPHHPVSAGGKRYAQPRGIGAGRAHRAGPRNRPRPEWLILLVHQRTIGQVSSRKKAFARENERHAQRPECSNVS